MSSSRITRNNQVVEVPAGGGAQTTVGSGLNRPYGVAVDGAGDVFIADARNNRVVEVTAGGGPQTTVGSGLSSPTGVAVDGVGDVFIADYANSRVVEVQRSAPPTFSFAATGVGSTSTDSPQSVTVQNIGNQLLNAVAPGLSIGSNSFVQVAGSGTPADCTSSFSLTPGASCNLSVSFTPRTTGSIASAATFTDNALNATAASQSLTLQGTGTPAATTVGISAPSVTYPGNGGGATVTVSRRRGRPRATPRWWWTGGAAGDAGVLDGSGVATFTLPSPSPGIYNLSASYAPQGGFAGGAGRRREP